MLNLLESITFTRLIDSSKRIVISPDDQVLGHHERTSWSGQGDAELPIQCQGKAAEMMFTIEFMRVRASDNAHAILDRLSNVAADLDEAKVSAKALFATWDLPQTPDALRILDKDGRELFFWSPGMQGA